MVELGPQSQRFALIKPAQYLANAMHYTLPAQVA